MNSSDESDSTTENELDIFLRINHDNIVRYFDHFHLEIGDDNQTFLITEFCEVKFSLSISQY
jgi:serine/threonine protein kinase